jgi:hypothetical protein
MVFIEFTSSHRVPAAYNRLKQTAIAVTLEQPLASYNTAHPWIFHVEVFHVEIVPGFAVGAVSLNTAAAPASTRQ